ncbi:pilus assembly protein [Phenylobacterium deserti]|uniref:Pilus assembly protein n=2 Tax=Phenylobacterium deserti TaxID=1914756 RepID=A0A328ATB8_9CAUL|nr:pilus assembly protein [Phenylobacterium deserti]
MTKLLARFRRAERGATAVEFGFIALPLMLLIFGLLELVLLFMVSATLDNATHEIARDIRTGLFQQGAAPSAETFRSRVCARMSWLAPNCEQDLYIQAQEFPRYADLAAAPPPVITPAAFPDPDYGASPQPSALPWQAGQACSIILVRTFYRWKLFTPLMGPIFETPGAGKDIRLVSSATAFRNEPYDVNPTASMSC